jgi:hypothetical protein
MAFDLHQFRTDYVAALPKLYERAWGKGGPYDVNPATTWAGQDPAEPERLRAKAPSAEAAMLAAPKREEVPALAALAADRMLASMQAGKCTQTLSASPPMRKAAGRQGVTKTKDLMEAVRSARICPDFQPPTIPGYTISHDGVEGLDRCIRYDGEGVGLELCICPGSEYPFDYSLWRDDAEEGDTGLVTGEGDQEGVTGEVLAAVVRLADDPRERGLTLAEAKKELHEKRARLQGMEGGSITLADSVDALQAFVDREEARESAKQAGRRIRDDAVALLNKAREELERIQDPEGGYVFQTDLHTLETLIEDMDSEEHAEWGD